MDRLVVGTRPVWRFVSPEVGTNMYVMLEGPHALLVDAHNSKEALAFLRANGVSRCTVLLTHEHTDHTCGLYALQQMFLTDILCQQSCASAIADWDNNRPSLVSAMLSIQDSREGTNKAERFLERYETHVYVADTVFDTQYLHEWAGERFVLKHTPGHSKGSCCILWNDLAVFTGDSLLRSVPVITRLPGGNSRIYKTKTLPFLELLDKALLALPGHGPAFCLGEL